MHYSFYKFKLQITTYMEHMFIHEQKFIIHYFNFSNIFEIIFITLMNFAIFISNKILKIKNTEKNLKTRFF